MSLIPGVIASGISGHLGGNYTSIATQTLGSATSTITFSSIPSTYTHLQLRGIWQNTAGGNGYAAMTFNGVTTGNLYSGHVLGGNGSSAFANTADGQSANLFFVGSSAQTSSMMTAGIIDILDYTNTNKNKTVRTFYGYDTNGGTYTQEIGLASGLFMSTNAISSLTLSLTQGTNFAQYSSFALYGVK